MDVGCVRITEKFLQHDPPRPEELSEALGEVRDQLEDAVLHVPRAPATRAGWSGWPGTVTTVAAVEMGLPAYDRDRIHHFWLTRAAAEDVFRTLATERRDDRARQPRPRAEAAST